MRLEDTYNIHKKINCILPFFKSKKLCKKGIHNYVINHKHYVIPHTELKDDGYRVIAKTIRYEHRDLINLKCICCGKEELLERGIKFWKL